MDMALDLQFAERAKAQRAEETSKRAALANLVHVSL